MLLSGSDQYVPPTVDMELLATRLASANGPTATSRVVPGARHALDGMEELGAEIISGFVSNVI